jgi:hypothetical protein
MVVAAGAAPAAQDPPPAGQRGGGRQPPVVRPNPLAGVRPQQVQAVQDIIDSWALVEGQRHLQLTDEQTPNFVARYMALQRVRRRLTQERNRVMREMQPLLQGPGPYRDEAIAEKLRALDDISQRAATEIRKALMEVDLVLTPVQRGRLRALEERLEAQKLEFLMSVRGGRGGAPPPAVPPQRGGGGGLR